MKVWVSILASVVLVTAQLQAQKCLKGDCRYGYGEKIFKSGAVYKGQFEDGQIQGQGEVAFSDGSYYSGDWDDNKRTGKGMMKFTNGDHYDGGFQQNQLQGKGIMRFSNGDYYEGEFKADKKDGYGIYKYKQGDIYEGHFKADLREGYGTMTYHTGSTYEGEWAGDRKNGKGVYTDEDGHVYEGDWKDGHFNSNDTPAESEGISDAPANENNAPNPPVTAMGGPADNLTDCNTHLCDGVMGVYVYSDGSKYIGTHAQGIPEGEGTIEYVNGDKYTGGWSQHAPHGKGIMIYSNGHTVSAVWEYGKPMEILDSDAGISEEHVEVDHNRKVKVWAVVVGIGRYEHMQTLKYTDDDAYRIYAFLKSPEGGAIPDEQIAVLIDEDATRMNMLRTMKRIFHKADDNDVVMLYFSGHGLKGAFVPSDFTGFNNLVQHTEVLDIFNGSSAKHKIVFADACHSGSMVAMRGASNIDATVDKYYSAFENTTGGTALLLSSKSEETSLEDSGLRQGVFSHFLMKGLRGEADKNLNKVVTVTELYRYVRREVQHYTAKAQTPTISGGYDKNMPVGIVVTR